MLLIFIPIAWLTVVTLLVAFCQTSARGEGRSPLAPQEGAYRVREGLVVFERAAAIALTPELALQAMIERPAQRARPSRRMRRPRGVGRSRAGEFARFA